MRLLFDANLSPKLVVRLADLFPGCVHAFDTDLARFASDEKVWDFARANQLTIVTADRDFLALSQLRGAPPKVVRIENCRHRTRDIELLLRRNAIRIADFAASDRPVLILRRAP